MIKRAAVNNTLSYHDWLIDSLRNKKNALAYLQESLAAYQNDGNAESLLLALRHVAEAEGGIAKLAQKSKLHRVTLYRTLSARGNPTLQTVRLLFNTLGFSLAVKLQ